MTKKDILQASADSLEAISKAYVVIGDAAGALDLIRAAILSAKDHIED